MNGIDCPIIPHIIDFLLALNIIATDIYIFFAITDG